MQTLIQQDEKQVIREMKSEHKRLQGSLAEAGKKLKDWQQSLGRGRFKRAYSAAGWTEAEVTNCFASYKNQQCRDMNSCPQPIDSIESPLETNELVDEPEDLPSPEPQVQQPPQPCSGEVCDPTIRVTIPEFGNTLIDVGDLGGVCQYFLLKIKRSNIERILIEALKEADEPEDLKLMWQFILQKLYREK